MRKIIAALVISTIGIGTASAYTIGGAYAEQVSCVWGQQGYEYGYIGTYKVEGKLYTVFFGNKYCAY